MLESIADRGEEGWDDVDGLWSLCTPVLLVMSFVKRREETGLPPNKGKKREKTKKREGGEERGTEKEKERKRKEERDTERGKRKEKEKEREIQYSTHLRETTHKTNSPK